MGIGWGIVGGLGRGIAEAAQSIPEAQQREQQRQRQHILDAIAQANAGASVDANGNVTVDPTKSSAYQLKMAEQEAESSANDEAAAKLNAAHLKFLSDYTDPKTHQHYDPNTIQLGMQNYDDFIKNQIHPPNRDPSDPAVAAALLPIKLAEKAGPTAAETPAGMAAKTKQELIVKHALSGKEQYDINHPDASGAGWTIKDDGEGHQVRVNNRTGQSFYIPAPTMPGGLPAPTPSSVPLPAGAPAAPRLLMSKQTGTSGLAAPMAAKVGQFGEMLKKASDLMPATDALDVSLGQSAGQDIATHGLAHIPGTQGLGSLLVNRSPEYATYQAALSPFILAAAHALSGARINQDQVAQIRSSVEIKPGDSPTVRAQKHKNVIDLINSIGGALPANAIAGQESQMDARSMGVLRGYGYRTATPSGATGGTPSGISPVDAAHAIQDPAFAAWLKANGHTP